MHILSLLINYPLGPRLRAFSKLFGQPLSHVMIGLLIVSVFMALGCRATRSSRGIIEGRPILEIERNEIPITPPIAYNNPLFIHEDRSVSIVDFERHRICCFDKSGRLIRTIGSIGQQDEDLYYPQGVYGKGDLIYVLNDSGKELKVFERSGRFVSKFALGDRLIGSYSLLVVGKEVVIPIRAWGRNIEDVHRQKLMTVFDSSGRILREFGKTIQCASAYAQHVFNSVYLALHRGIIYGAFRNLPIIFAYDLNGNEIYFKNLTDAGISEIDKLVRQSREELLDTPEKIGKDGGINGMTYCRGIGVNKRQFYFALPDSILVFDDQGRFRTSIHISIEQSLQKGLAFITMSPGGLIYGLAYRPEFKTRFLFRTN